MDLIKSKRLKVLGASALAFILATATSFLLLTTNNDANAKSKKTQTTVMAKQKTPEPPQPPATATQKKKNAKEEATQAQATPTPNPPTKPKSLEERLKEDLQRASEANRQNNDVEAFRTANAVANTIARNKLDKTGENAETFNKYYQDAVEIAKTSGERLQKKNNNHDKPLVFVF